MDVSKKPISRNRKQDGVLKRATKKNAYVPQGNRRRFSLYGWLPNSGSKAYEAKGKTGRGERI